MHFNLGKLYGVRDGIKDSCVYYYVKAILYDPERFQKINHTVADFYYDNKRFTEAKTYYKQSLEKPTSVRYWDVERLVNIYIEEKNFLYAENVLKQYLDSSPPDKNLYEKLEASIKAASEKN